MPQRRSALSPDSRSGSRTSTSRPAWVQAGNPLCLIGDSGTGKSHLLIGLGTAIAEADGRVRYTTAANLVNELAGAATGKRLCQAIVDRLTFEAHIIETGTRHDPSPSQDSPETSPDRGWDQHNSFKWGRYEPSKTRFGNAVPGLAPCVSPMPAGERPGARREGGREAYAPCGRRLAGQGETALFIGLDMTKPGG